MARKREDLTEPAPVVCVTRASLAKHLADSFRDGTSLIDTPQKHPPPVGLGVQAPAQFGRRNYLPRTHEEELRGEPATGCKVERRNPVTMYKRSRFGLPVMEPNPALPTLEALVARAYGNALAKNGCDVGNARFATMQQANLVNKAFTGQSKGSSILMPSAAGLGLDLKPAEKDTRAVGQQISRDSRTGGVRRDPNGQPITETVEVPIPEGGRHESKMKVLYNTDDFAFDTVPERVDRVDPSDRATVYDEKGEKIDVSRGTVGRVLYNAEGKHAYKNFDDQGNSIPPRIGEIRRDSDGDALMRSVARTGRTAHELTTVDKALAGVNHALKDQAGRSVDGFETEVTIVRSDETKDLDLELQRRDPTDPESITRVTLTMPAEFDSSKAELAFLSRACAHLEQLVDSDNPNHTNATRAAEMPASKRAGSKEFASVELVAQHAAMNNVTRAGETWTPLPKEHNDKFREQWAAEVEDPDGRGIQRFADSVDRCSRVVSGKQPTYELDISRANQNRAEGAARTRAERAAPGFSFGMPVPPAPESGPDVDETPYGWRSPIRTPATGGQTPPASELTCKVPGFEAGATRSPDGDKEVSVAWVPDLPPYPRGYEVKVTQNPDAHSPVTTVDSFHSEQRRGNIDVPISCDVADVSIRAITHPDSDSSGWSEPIRVTWERAWDRGERSPVRGASGDDTFDDRVERRPVPRSVPPGR